jgi:hypothetical protein
MAITDFTNCGYYFRSLADEAFRCVVRCGLPTRPFALMTQYAQITERKYCRPHARPFRLRFARVAVSSLLACYSLGPPASAAQYSCRREPLHRPFGMAGARRGLPVRLDRAPQRGAAFAITRASRRARTSSIGSRSRARGLSLIFYRPPPVASARLIRPSAGNVGLPAFRLLNWQCHALFIDIRPGCHI